MQPCRTVQQRCSCTHTSALGAETLYFTDRGIDKIRVCKQISRICVTCKTPDWPVISVFVNSQSFADWCNIQLHCWFFGLLFPAVFVRNESFFWMANRSRRRHVDACAVGSQGCLFAAQRISVCLRATSLADGVPTFRGASAKSR